MAEGKMRGYAEKLIEKLKGNRRLELAVYALLVLLCALLCLPSFGKKNEEGSKDEYKAQGEKYNESDDVEQRLMDTLSLVRGAGKVKVMITYETGTEIVPAMSTDVSTSVSGADATGQSENRTEAAEPVTVYRDGENEAVVLMERMPKVRGVIVVAEGAADFSVKLKLQSAVQAVLGVEAARVEVLEMGISGIEE